jgi:hypothetical protein
MLLYTELERLKSIPITRGCDFSCFRKNVAGYHRGSLVFEKRGKFLGIGRTNQFGDLPHAMNRLFRPAARGPGKGSKEDLPALACRHDSPKQ